MKLLSQIKKWFSRHKKATVSDDEVEITLYGMRVKVIRRMLIPALHEVSVFVPRLELTNKVTEEDKTTETSVILNSLTIVSAPRCQHSGPAVGVPSKSVKLHSL